MVNSVAISVCAIITLKSIYVELSLLCVYVSILVYHRIKNNFENFPSFKSSPIDFVCH